MARRVFLAAIVLLLAAPVAAQEGTHEARQSWRVDRMIELPGHRALAQARAASGDALTPFETDGCSGGMSAVWGFVSEQLPDFASRYGADPPWEGCCVAHDRLYHAAGSDPDPDASFDARLAADAELRVCVRETLEDDRMKGEVPPQAGAAIVEAMHLAVRLGGAPCTGLPWRWGYGRARCSVFAP